MQSLCRLTKHCFVWLWYQWCNIKCGSQWRHLILFKQYQLSHTYGQRVFRKDKDIVKKSITKVCCVTLDRIFENRLTQFKCLCFKQINSFVLYGVCHCDHSIQVKPCGRHLDTTDKIYRMNFKNLIFEPEKCALSL